MSTPTPPPTVTVTDADSITAPVTESSSPSTLKEDTPSSTKTAVPATTEPDTPSRTSGPATRESDTPSKTTSHNALTIDGKGKMRDGDGKKAEQDAEKAKADTKTTVVDSKNAVVDPKITTPANLAPLTKTIQPKTTQPTSKPTTKTAAEAAAEEAKKHVLKAPSRSTAVRKKAARQIQHTETTDLEGARGQVWSRGVLKESIERLTAAYIKRFENMLALLPVEDNADKASTGMGEVMMGVEAQGLVRVAEDTLRLTRQLQELWLFGNLDTQGKSSQEVRMEADAKGLAEALEMLARGEGVGKKGEEKEG